jgi:hypothetical protein
MPSLLDDSASAQFSLVSLLNLFHLLLSVATWKVAIGEFIGTVECRRMQDPVLEEEKGGDGISSNVFA